MEYKQRHAKAHIGSAFAYSRCSYANRKKVGVVFINGDKSISHGWNGTPTGQDNVCEDENNVTLPSVIHAEINALNKTSGSELLGSVAYITLSPCLGCVTAMIARGVKGVVFIEQYRSNEGVIHLLGLNIPVYKYYPITETFTKLSLYNPYYYEEFPHKGNLVF
jgi:dCMP deaminase